MPRLLSSNHWQLFSIQICCKNVIQILPHLFHAPIDMVAPHPLDTRFLGGNNPMSGGIPAAEIIPEGATP